MLALISVLEPRGFVPPDNSERINQLNIFEEGTDVLDVSAVIVAPRELKPRFIKYPLKIIFFCRGLCCQSRLCEGAYF